RHGTVAKDEGAGMADGGAEEVRELEGELDRAIAAHRESADAAAFAGGSGAKGGIDEGDEVAHERRLPGHADLGIAIESAAAVRHNDDKWEVGGVSLNAGAALPHRVIVREAMQEIEGSEGTRAI